MMYYDYGNLKLDDISLYREVQEEKVLIIGEYRFSDMLDGFNSYLEKDELPTNRADLLDSIKGLEKLSKEDQNKNLFKEFIVTYHAFVEKTSSLVPFGDFAEAFDLAEELKSEPFGKNIVMCFNKSISITGFGAAVGKLTDFKLVSGFEEVRQLMGELKIGGDPYAVILNLLSILNKIKKSSKKIGNAQRLFFLCFFRELLNKQGDSFLMIDNAIENGYQKYRNQTE